MNKEPNYAPVTEFIEQLKTVQWFANLGKSSPWDQYVQRVHSWEEIPSPDHPPIEAFALQTQAWKDALLKVRTSKRDKLSLDTAWQETHTLVMHSAAAKVAFDPDQDAYHAPSLSVWSAAWMASVISCYRLYARPLPEETEEVWAWFLRGHWPCGYAEIPKDEQPAILLVY